MTNYVSISKNNQKTNTTKVLYKKIPIKTKYPKNKNNQKEQNQSLNTLNYKNKTKA